MALGASLTVPQHGLEAGQPAAVPAGGGSFAWTEDARCLFFLSVLKTVTASEKYPGGPGWESASASFAQGGSPARPAGAGDGERRGGDREGRRSRAEAPARAEGEGGRRAPGSAERERTASRCWRPGRQFSCSPGARGWAQEAGPGRGPGAGGASEREPSSHPSRPRPERALEMLALRERTPAAPRALRRR